MARQLTNAKPKNMKRRFHLLRNILVIINTLLFLLDLLVILSTSISLWGTYQIKTVVNRYVLKNDYHGLVSFIVLMAIVYFIGATATAIYKQLMVHTAQSIVQELRNDLFAKMQKLPISYFDGQETSPDLKIKFFGFVFR